MVRKEPEKKICVRSRASGDNIGASFILVGAAGIITLIVRAGAEPEEHS
jgi:hypothetical protein